MNNYETVFILNPVLSEDQTKETVKKIEDYLTSNNAKIVNKENWGLKKMAYPIQNKKSGFYNLIEFEAEGDLINSLEIQMKREERIMRFLTVSMDKHAIAYSEIRKAKIKETKNA